MPQTIMFKQVALCMLCMICFVFGESFETSLDYISKQDKLPKQDAKAMQTSDTAYELRRVVTTGSALKTDIADIPGNVSIIDSAHIRKMPNQKIVDIVKKTAGVRIENDVSFNPRPKITIRGVNYGTLLMLDGVILSDLEGEARILNQITLYDIERVEVARGAYSSLYGAGAIGGAVHFITSMPKDFEVKTLASYGSELIEYGAEKNLVQLYASVGDVFWNKRLKLKLSAGYKGSGGVSSFPTYFSQANNPATSSDLSGYYVDKAGQTIIGSGGRRAYHIGDVRLKASLSLSDSDELSMMTSFSTYAYDFNDYRSNLYDRNGTNTFLINGENYFIGSGLGGLGQYSHLLSSLKYMHSFEKAFLQVFLASVNLFSWWQDALQDQGSSFSGGLGQTQDTNSSSNYADFVYQDSRFASARIPTNFTIGAQLRYYYYLQDSFHLTNWRDKLSRTELKRRVSSEAVVASVYANIQNIWLDSSLGKLRSDLGLRYDFWHDFNGRFFNQDTPSDNKNNLTSKVSIFSPKFALAYSPPFLSDLTLKTSIGTGFRMPTMRDKYQFTHASNYWAINQNLRHEQALNFEVGTEYRRLGFEASLYYFHLVMKDMIYRSGSGRSDDPWQYINAGRGRIHGLESNINIPIAGALALEASYTLTLTEILENSARPQSVGKQVVGMPKHMAYMGLNFFPKYGLYGSLYAYYAWASYNNDANTPIIPYTYGSYDEQFTLNLKFGYVWRNGLNIGVQFLNMTNNRYYDFYQVSGASFGLQVAYGL